MSRTPIERRRDILRGQLILCMGTGGVGKTSTAAALACTAAMRGRRCGLITVDPARRLRSALGLDHLSTSPTRIDLDAAGSLFAMALDTKRVFDDLIERVAPSPAIAAAILGNPLYRELSNELGGSTEYMAMETLHQLLTTGDYDLLVVDTPPSAHARELLDAPTRIAALVDSGAARILRAPSSVLRGNRFADATLAAILALLERWIGRGLVRNLSDFAAAFEPLLAGFRERASQVQDTLRAEGTSIVIITTAETDALRSTVNLHHDLIGVDLPIAGIIANRVHTVPRGDERPRLRCAAPLREKMDANYAEYAARADRDRMALHQMAAPIAPILATIPQLEAPISTIDHLASMARILDARLAGRRAR